MVNGMKEDQRVIQVLDQQAEQIPVVLVVVLPLPVEVQVILQELQDKLDLLQAVEVLGIQVLDHPVAVEVQQGQAQAQVLQVVVKHQTGGNLKPDLILFRPGIHQKGEQEIGMHTCKVEVILEVVKGNQIHQNQSLKT